MPNAQCPMPNAQSKIQNPKSKMHKDSDFITVNQLLGKEASIGFIPASQILPWIAIIIISYAFTNGFFSLGIPWFLAISFWLIVSWWLLTLTNPHLFVDKFRPPPGHEWCNGNLLYLSPLTKNRPKPIREKIKDSTTRLRLKPLVKPLPNGQSKRFMPFQNFHDLVCLVEIKKDNRTVSGYLLNRGNQYQIVFGFRTKGFHNLGDSNEISNAAIALEEGLKELPPGEKMTVHTGCYSLDSERQFELTQLADNCGLTPISILVRNEQKRVQELTLNGTRQTWNQIIFCTWTFHSASGSASTDLIGKSLRFLSQSVNLAVGWFTGNEQIYQEQFYQQLLLKSFEQGFVPWEILLNTKIGLETRPCSSDELWTWLWKKFNADSIAPTPIPQLLLLEETANDYSLLEIKHSDKDPCTVLIEGQFGRSSCPEHRGSNDSIWLPGRNTKCAVLTMEERPAGWTNQKEQLRWLWTILSKNYVRDTEAVVEISAASAALIKDNLARQAKQSKSAQKRALTKGQGRDAGAEVKAEESFDAQKKLYKGAKAINAAVTFGVYRSEPEELNLACMKLANSFGSAKVLRERNIAWAIWLETLPTTTSWLLHSSSLLSERRQVFDTETVPGVMPLTIVRDLDKKGVEFLTQGGKPVYVDLLHDQTSRAVITGESGSGKSVLGWRFIVDALAANVPVVGIDISSGSGSTFKTAVELLGDRGAYYDISQTSSNLLEPPDLRRFAPKDRTSRMKQWKEFIRKALTSIAMGKVRDPRLAQRVDNIVLKTLEVFLGDPDIISRYNAAFEKGWKSMQWQDMPVLSDWLKFCTKEQLKIHNFEPIDQAAINQIHSQITALLASALGTAVGRPSTFSPEPAIKFFALSDLSNEQDQYLMAINAHAACIRNALASPRSLFVGDELSVLFKKDGFAEAVGELCAVGRKNGISVLLLAQDLDSICDCSAGAQIMQNLVYRITGRLTTNGAASWIKRLGSAPDLIYQNATENFLPKLGSLYSNWLIEKNGRYWQARFYPGEMILATVANNQAELNARARIMSQYPKTMRGQMMGLKQFTKEYVQAIKQGLPLERIGRPNQSLSLTDFNQEQNSKNGKSSPYPIASF